MYLRYQTYHIRMSHTLKQLHFSLEVFPQVTVLFGFSLVDDFYGNLKGLSHDKNIPESISRAIGNEIMRYFQLDIVCMVLLN